MAKAKRIVTASYLRDQSKEVLVATILKLRNRFAALHNKFIELDADVDALYDINQKTRKRHVKK